MNIAATLLVRRTVQSLLCVCGSCQQLTMGKWRRVSNHNNGTQLYGSRPYTRVASQRNSSFRLGVSEAGHHHYCARRAAPASLHKDITAVFNTSHGYYNRYQHFTRIIQQISTRAGDDGDERRSKTNQHHLSYRAQIGCGADPLARVQARHHHNLLGRLWVA